MINLKDIQKKILTVRNHQVMLDSDLAEFYGIETKMLNRAVKRNIERFPDNFIFKLTLKEWESLRFQTGTSKNKGGRRYIPFVFTEQGVAMLSAVLHTKTAVKMSIQIINAFVEMRHFLMTHAQIFRRLDALDIKQLKTDEKVESVLKALEKNKIQPEQGIFFDGQVFDAYKFINNLIRKAKKSIILIDNYIDDSILDILTKRDKNVSAAIYTKIITKQLKLDLKKHNEQYPKIEIKEFGLSHDRFIIIDNSDVYHIGASLKDLGKKWFAFSKIEIEAFSLLSKIK